MDWPTTDLTFLTDWQGAEPPGIALREFVAGETYAVHDELAAVAVALHVAYRADVFDPPTGPTPPEPVDETPMAPGVDDVDHGDQGEPAAEDAATYTLTPPTERAPFVILDGWLRRHGVEPAEGLSNAELHALAVSTADARNAASATPAAPEGAEGSTDAVSAPSVPADPDTPMPEGGTILVAPSMHSNMGAMRTFVTEYGTDAERAQPWDGNKAELHAACVAIADRVNAGG